MVSVVVRNTAEHLKASAKQLGIVSASEKSSVFVWSSVRCLCTLQQYSFSMHIFKFINTAPNSLRRFKIVKIKGGK